MKDWKYRIKTWKELKKICKEEDGNLFYKECGTFFHKGMKCICGKIVDVKHDSILNYPMIELGDTNYIISDWMINDKCGLELE